MRNKKIYIVIPAFNEKLRIKIVIEAVKTFADKIIVVDDGSTDNTAEQIISKKVVLLKHCFNLGQGAALQTGFQYAKQEGADIVITYDADGQFIASEIPLLIKPLIEGRADIALGSRFLGKTVNMPTLKFIILKLGIIFTYLYSGIKLTDTHNGLRALNKKALRKISITQNRMAHSSEILDQIKQYQLKFTEVPVTVSYDDYTKKKGQNVFSAFRITYDLIAKKLY